MNLFSHPTLLYLTKYQTYVCPICGVASNLYPDYTASKGTAVIQRFSYCDHVVDLPQEIKP